MTEGTGSAATAASERCRSRQSAFATSYARTATLDQITIRLASPPDLPAIHAFARAYMNDLKPGEVTACLSDPAGSPNDTVLAWDGKEVVGVAQLARRSLLFGPARCTVGVIRWLYVVPEYRSTAVAQELLKRLERHARSIGLQVGLSWDFHTQLADLEDWVSIYRPPFVELKVDPFLAELSAQGLLPLKGPRTKVIIRPARLWDVGALAKFYAESVQGAYGASERSEAMWKWLLGRRGFDQFYVAVPAQAPNAEPGASAAPVTQKILGYYIRRGWRIVELLAPSRRALGLDLLVHACREAKEQNRTWMLVDLPGFSPLRPLVGKQANSAQEHYAFDGPSLMAKVWDVVGLLETLLPHMEESALRHGLCKSAALGLEVPPRQMCLKFDGKLFSRIPCGMARNWVRLSPAELTRLLFTSEDQLPTEDVLQVGRNASSRCAIVLTRMILRPPRFWRSTFDDLPSLG